MRSYVPDAGSKGASIEGTVGSKHNSSHAPACVLDTCVTQLGWPPVPPSSLRARLPIWSIQTLIQTWLPGSRVTGVIGFGLLNAPAHTSATAGLTYAVTLSLSLIPDLSGFSITSVKVPSCALPKYWKPVLVSGVSKSSTVVTTGGGARV